MDALAIDRPDPHGLGFYKESKEFVYYYRLALNLKAEKAQEEERKRKAKEGMAENGLYLPY